MKDAKRLFIEELYNSYAKRIADWAYRHLGDYELAKDIVQDTFLIAVIKVEDLMRSDNPQRWLYVTARNLIGHAIREKKKKVASFANDFPTSQVNNGISLGLSELFPQSFSTYDRQLLSMYYLERRSIKEIADLYGISLSACKMRLLRLRKELKNVLNSCDQSI